MIAKEVRTLRTSYSALFAVRTPTATVTDLGTEFGVEVDKAGTTQSHVFRGSVELQTVPASGEATPPSCILHENEQATVENTNVSGRIVVCSASKTVDFVRALPRRTIKTLDLVDVVAGGDGFSGKRSRGIDPTTGNIVALALRGGPIPLSSDGQYHRVAAMPFVDGVFIPHGGKKEVQVDSVGHIFTEFRGTAQTTWQAVWAGGPCGPVSTEVGGVDYASPGLCYFLSL